MNCAGCIVKQATNGQAKPNAKPHLPLRNPHPRNRAVPHISASHRRRFSDKMIVSRGAEKCGAELKFRERESWPKDSPCSMATKAAQSASRPVNEKSECHVLRN